ncbi:fibrinogen alpha chain-like [Lingula anatina]|uniref:Fibrinogen alpha chain-like n=1 Tax=Lingula anatina TaxID=7574 RepID=A0A1S3JHV9_LINAN|nr:fibrinogen alpha chain-like [Lingula anatina]|eukprot:XP_013409721.1 fibrinogen alpha chain-like [Lingula anatina]
MAYINAVTLSMQPVGFPRVFKARCRGKWLVIQSRKIGDLFFNRTWAEYTKGFGNPVLGDYWIGNDIISYVTNSGNYRLKVELTTWDGTQHVFKYTSFRVGSPSDGYRLFLQDFKGFWGVTNFTSNDSSCPSADTCSSGQTFSTCDYGGESHCACANGGGWWYGPNCTELGLNSWYPGTGHCDVNSGQYECCMKYAGMEGENCGLNCVLEKVEMMIAK